MKFLKYFHEPIYQYRLRVLVNLISPHLQPNDRVLDIGCGFGQLGEALMRHVGAENIVMEGCEKFPRGKELIPVSRMDGYEIAAEDDAYDVTILADVVHHEEEPERLLREVCRVTKRYVIIKDHIPVGILAQQRISLIDWAANTAYGVKCLFRYFSVKEWHRYYEEWGGRIVEEKQSINLYPVGVNLLFGKKLQYFAVISLEQE